MENASALLPDDLGQAEVDVGRGVQGDARVAPRVFVVLEEPRAGRGRRRGRVGNEVRSSAHALAECLGPRRVVRSRW
jgi:hypothetical protein